ncbi:MAG TPA: hypothetical protein VIM79_11555 [Niastella sp.]
MRVTTGLNSTTPLGNAAVELGWKYPGEPFGNPGRLIASGTTADDGSVSFSFKAKPNELQGGKFYVTAKNGNDYFVQENSYYGIQRYDSIVTANIHVPGKATIKIIYKNFTPVTADDAFECSPRFLTYGSNVFGVEMKKADGQSSNTFFLGKDNPFTSLELTGTTAGNQYTWFTILKKKNGVRVDLQDSIYIEKGQTKTYEIDY